MDSAHQKEQFSIAYVYAIAAAAGFGVYDPRPDIDSVDVGIVASGKFGLSRSPRVELQLKCTSSPVWHGEHLSFPLKIKNYVDLRGDDFSVARILVVLVVPEAVDEWVVHSNEELLLRRSCYWTSLRTAPEVDNDTQVTVPIPKHQQFNVSTLRTIMQAIGNWNPP